MEDSGHRLLAALGGCLQHFASLWTLLIVLGIGALLALWLGVSEQDPVALVALGGVVTLVMILIGVALTIGIIAFANWSQMRREIREQARFVQNAKENMALMQMTTRAQATQNKMLLNQAREAQRQLPAPVEDGPSIVYDVDIFDELELGED